MSWVILRCEICRPCYHSSSTSTTTSSGHTATLLLIQDLTMMQQLCTVSKTQIFSELKNHYQYNIFSIVQAGKRHTEKLGDEPTELKGNQEFPISDLETEPRCLPLSCFSMAGTGIEDRWRKQATARFLNYAARPARSLCKIQILSNKCWSNWHKKKIPTCIFKLLEKASAEALVAFIMQIMIKHFQKWSLILSGSTSKWAFVLPN